MTKFLRIGLSCIGLAAGGHAAAQVTFYEREDYQGQSIATSGRVVNLQRLGFNDRASSLVVQGRRGDRWEVCEDPRFRGRCVVLAPGRYASLAAMGLNNRVSSVRAASPATPQDEPRSAARPALPEADSRIVFYENDGFQGRSMTATEAVDDFRRSGFNDRASSAVVSGGRWEACPDARYDGHCVVLRPGQYPSLAAMGLQDRISSVRTVERGAPVDARRYAPLPLVARDYGRRDDERLYQADITAVRAVVEDSGQRCWVEPQQVPPERSSSANVPGALLGAVIGGILGHQVGGGTGQNVATGIGIVAGAAIGGNSGRGGDEGSQRVVTTQNVQRCTHHPEQARAAYWDVTYSFRGQPYRVQMDHAPGRTVTVNAQGEPRG